MSEENTYEQKLLYTQSCTTEEGIAVKTNVYAVKWKYPGAVSSITSRVRVTAAYETEAGDVYPINGAIERWSDKGWLLLDDYCESNKIYENPEAFLNALAKMAYSFITGTAIGNVGIVSEQVKTAQPLSEKKKEKTTKDSNLKVIDFKGRIKAKDKKTKKEDPDFDWV